MFVIVNDINDFYSYKLIDVMVFQNLIWSKMRFLSVWTMSNHIFMSIFHFLEFIKLIVGSKRPNTNKIVSFGGF